MIHPVKVYHRILLLGVGELPKYFHSFREHISSFEVDALDYYRFAIHTCRGDTLIATPNDYIVIGEFGEVYIIDFPTYKNLMLKEG